MNGKIETLLELDFPFCIGVGDLFGNMDWFIIIHSDEYRKVRTGWGWVNSDDYFDIWLLTLSNKEVVEFREKYKHLFYRNKHDDNGTVYEKKEAITFQEIYKKRRNLRLEEKRRQTLLRMEKSERQRWRRKKVKAKKKKKEIEKKNKKTN